MTSSEYAMILGLEVHVQLKTQTKLFCRCSTEFGAPPNTQVCPVCLGLPGALPVLNRRAVDLAIRAGLAFQSTIPNFTKWDRKNYFYPDLPKGYQISQFDLPICVGGQLSIQDPSDNSSKVVRLIRAHLEEDAGKSMHDEHSGTADTRIDLNRTGTPLLEIVSHPDLESAEQAKAYLTELRLLLLYLDVSDCNMQEGSLRVDANINLRIPMACGQALTPITEIKNLNSFRAVERAIQYEATRQYQQWKVDGRVKGDAPKQTRGWDDSAGITTLQREKEESADYRYFPDPDLVPVTISALQIDQAAQSLGELPQSKRQRYQDAWDLKAYDADVIVAQGRSVAEYFEATIAAGAPAKRASAWMQQDILRTLKDQEITIQQLAVTPGRLAELLVTIEAGTLDTSRGREVFQSLLKDPSLNVAQAIDRLGIRSADATEVEALCRELLRTNPEVVAKVKSGNPKALASLIGPAKKINPNADPRQIQDICNRLIAEGAA
jgi:aspartyl-tRNA(Asn)/glutamyl-tRNA(Gln) amidotransferase subunit B